MTLKKMLCTTLVAAASIMLVTAAEPAGAARNATAGDLARGLERVAGAGGSEASSRLIAQLQLAVPAGRAEALLTEGLAVDILRAVGLEASTRTPDRLVSQDRLGSLLIGFTDGLASAAVAARGGAPRPESLDDCFALANHGQCVECCKALGNRANTCARACFVINKPSPSEPLP